MILQKLKHAAEEYLGEKVTEAVITVPAYFNDSQRQATKDAGRIAGLEVLRIVNEPTAASLAYGLNLRKQGTVAIYDLGGGTFDISLLKIKDGIFEVLAISGDTHLGGDDIDHRLMEFFREDLEREAGRSLRTPAETLQALKEAVEAAKCQLSETETAEVKAPLAGGGEFRRLLDRRTFEALASPVIERTVPPCRQAMKDAGLRPEDIDEVIRVGGSTLIPMVRRTVEEVFGKTPKSELNPREVVALGAAIQADILAGGIRDMLLLDVTPLSLGIEVMGGVVSVLIPRNTTIPTQSEEVFTTYVDGQTSVDIHVLQGERELVKDNRSLARFQLKGIGPMAAGLPRVGVKFLLDANGILNVTARDLRSGKEQSIDVKPSYGLTDEEVDRMIRESFEWAEQDVNARLLIEAKTEAETVIRATEKALRQGAHLVSETEEKEIQEALGGLRQALQGEDRHAIREWLDKLNDATLHLAQALMDEGLRRALKDRRVEEVLGG
jgi:molecular chaperone DnaK (HSP70)